VTKITLYHSFSFDVRFGFARRKAIFIALLLFVPAALAHMLRGGGQA